MRWALLVLAWLSSALAQEPTVQPPPAESLKVVFYAQAEPASARNAVALNGWKASRSQEGEDTVIHMWVYSASRSRYWGCDILLQREQENEFYLARFRPFTLSGADITKDVRALHLGDPSQWKLQPPLEYPAPQRIRVGGTLAIDLMVDVVAGEKLVGYLHLAHSIPVRTIDAAIGKMTAAELQALDAEIAARLQVVESRANAAMMAILNGGTFVPPVPAPPVPPVPGTPRDFLAEDAEMRIVAPRIHFDGDQQDLRSAASLNGILPWFYLPGRGRFVISLAARAGFVEAGAAEGPLLRVKDGEETITLESLTPIVPGYTPFKVYLHRDETWRPGPTRPDSIQLGTIDAQELMRRQ